MLILHNTLPTLIQDQVLQVKILKIRRIQTMINKIRLNILKGAKPESFRFSSLNIQKITFAGFNKPRNQSKRIAA